MAYYAVVSFQRVMVLALAGLVIPSCGNGSTSQIKKDGMLSNIVAGPGEKSFSEKYDRQLVLPVAEQDFLAVLKKNGLDFSIIGAAGTDKVVPTPRLSTIVDMSHVSKVYQVYGRIDRVRRVGEMYRAYVDTSHRVIYVENAYAYTGP